MAAWADQHTPRSSPGRQARPPTLTRSTPARTWRSWTPVRFMSPAGTIRLREMKSRLRAVAQEPKDLPRPKYLDPADVPETQKIPVAREQAVHAGSLGGRGQRGVRRVP